MPKKKRPVCPLCGKTIKHLPAVRCPHCKEVIDLYVNTKEDDKEEIEEAEEE